MLPVLDLFSGIGGFSLGLERTGRFRTVAFVEIDPYCNKVLAKYWPDVRRYSDVKEVTAIALRSDGIERPAVICGGFPCQDISNAGKREGIRGLRSGLWSEFARLIGEIQPSWAVVENVSALRGRGLDRVLGDLASLGYDAEWHCIPASAVGAPHQRDRIWIVAHTNREGLEIGQGFGGDTGEELAPVVGSGWWDAGPDVGRVAHGVSSRVDRLRALGNSLVPQVAELIGHAIAAQCDRFGQEAAP